MKITLNVRHLLAANVFASKEETRYYLNGVFVKREKGQLAIVATDGHRLAKFETKSKGADFAFIIPSSLLKNIKVDKRSHSDIELVKYGTKLTLSYEGASYSAVEIDGTFPDYNRVFPDFNGKAAEMAAERKRLTRDQQAAAYKNVPVTFRIGFNAGYMGDFKTIGKIFGVPSAGIAVEMMNESAPAKITMSCVPEFVGLLMPMRL